MEASGYTCYYLYCQRWTDFTHCYNVYIVDFEQVNASWDRTKMKTCSYRTISILYLKN